MDEEAKNEAEENKKPQKETQKDNAPMKAYSADSIQALEGMEHVRMRPSMYIGDVGVRGIWYMRLWTTP